VAVLRLAGSIRNSPKAVVAKVEFADEDGLSAEASEEIKAAVTHSLEQAAAKRSREQPANDEL